MGRLSFHVGRTRAGIALALLATLIAAPTAAFADKGKGGGDDRKEVKQGGHDFDDERGGERNNLQCPGRETLVRVDEVTCPPNKNRPLIVRKRACCQNPAGRVHCDHFPHCPHESPS
jgi:hypothetical protein